jgi:hypothetical protein
MVGGMRARQWTPRAAVCTARCVRERKGKAPACLDETAGLFAPSAKAMGNELSHAERVLIDITPDDQRITRGAAREAHARRQLLKVRPP